MNMVTRDMKRLKAVTSKRYVSLESGPVGAREREKKQWAQIDI